MEFIFVLFILGFGFYAFIMGPAEYAGNRGSSYLGWFILSMFIPGITWALVLILYSGRQKVR